MENGRIKKSIVIYNDSPIWGGHEIMTAHLVNTLKMLKYDISFIYFHDKFEQYIDKTVNKYRISISSKVPFPFLRNLNIKDILEIKNLFLKLNSDLFLISQGTIELSLKGLIAAKTVGKPIISYIPLVYNMSFIKNSRIHAFRDFIDNFYFKLPDFFITPSEIQSKKLKKKTDASIFTLHNFVNMDNIAKRKFLTTPSTFLQLGFVGRLKNEQKNLDDIVELGVLLSTKKKKYRFHIIGEGEDKEWFISLLKKYNILNNFIFYGWKNQTDIFSILKDNVDIILIPSRFEASPLVLIETIINEIPFMVSNIESFYEIPNKYKYSSIEELFNKINKMKYEGYDRETLFKLKKNFSIKYSKQNFERNLKFIFNEILKKINYG